MKKQKKIKLTQEQKDVIMLMYRAHRYFETIQKKAEKVAEDKFIKDIENVINDFPL